MTRKEKIAEAQRLRAQGLTFQQIAERLGYKNPKSAWVLVNPNRGKQIARQDNARRREAKQEYARNQRSSCPRCGAPMGSGSKWASRQKLLKTGLCGRCEKQDRTESFHKRAEQIEAWWNEGLSMNEIAQRLGCSKGSLGYRLDRLRARGYDLPYRHRYKRPVHSDQVAA